jgi:hypothetical protein
MRRAGLGLDGLLAEGLEALMPGQVQAAPGTRSKEHASLKDWENL